jgi:hypothetical protein
MMISDDRDDGEAVALSTALPDVVSPQEKDILSGDSGLQFLRTFEKGFITLGVPVTLAMYIRFYQRVPDMGIASFWCAIPMYVEGRGYETFEYDAGGRRVYVGTLDEFRSSAENSIHLFLGGESSEETSREIMAALSCGLLRPSE